MSQSFFPASIILAPLVGVAAVGFACMFYRDKNAPAGCAAYTAAVIAAAVTGYVFGLYYGGDWAFHSGQIDCGTSGITCALIAVMGTGPMGAAFAVTCAAVFLGRR